jgi:hypothetical protein
LSRRRRTLADEPDAHAENNETDYSTTNFVCSNVQWKALSFFVSAQVDRFLCGVDTFIGYLLRIDVVDYEAYQVTGHKVRGALE